MKKSLYLVVSLLVALSMILAACQTAPTEAPAAEAPAAATEAPAAKLLQRKPPLKQQIPVFRWNQPL